MKYILDRLKETSTYVGITGVLVSFGLFGFTPVEWNAIFGAVAALAGAIGIFVKEKSE